MEEKQLSDIYVYLVSLPPGIHEIVTPCRDGYTVYIDNDLSYSAQIDAYRHAMRHIQNGDLDNTEGNVQDIERRAHGM